MTFRPSFLRGGLMALTVAICAMAGQSQAVQPEQKKPQPKVEVVFVLDTTGSMGGLINAAKQKIWTISNQIVSGKPTPAVKIGLVAFRDRGDAYITKVFDLTGDLDAVHANLMSFQAAGGGDTPESVNQALDDAVNKIGWSNEKGTLKLIFLVGDAPPHMDYPDDVKYTDTCKVAVNTSIIINTVQCGSDAQTKKYWLDICRLAEGQYVQIDAKGGSVAVIETPFDKELAAINAEMMKTTLVFGDAKMQAAAGGGLGGFGAKGEAGKGAAGKKGAAPLSPAAAADRAAYFGQLGKGTSFDLLQNIKDGKVQLEKLKKEELPEEMRNMTLNEQKAHLDKIDKQRQELNAKAADLATKRNAYLAEKQREAIKSAAPDSFDGQVLQLLQQQATRIQVDYGIPNKK